MRYRCNNRILQRKRFYKKHIGKRILPENIALSAITLMELYFGAKSKKELILIKKFLSAFEILKLNEKITDLSLNLIEIYSKSHSLKREC